MRTGTVSSGITVPGLEADYLSAPTIEIKNVWKYSSFLCLPAVDTDKFTYY